MERFLRGYRLLKTDDFSSVFALRRRRSGHFFYVYHKPNTLTHPRLGLVVAKKVARRAHERNYMKRCVREWFRRHRALLPAADYVVQARIKFMRNDYPHVVTDLKQLLR